MWGKAVSHILHACPLPPVLSPWSWVLGTSVLSSLLPRPRLQLECADPRGLSGEWSGQAKERKRRPGWREETGRFTPISAWPASILYPARESSVVQEAVSMAVDRRQRANPSSALGVGMAWRGTSWHDRLDWSDVQSPSWPHPIAFIAACLLSLSGRTRFQPAGSTFNLHRISTLSRLGKAIRIKPSIIGNIQEETHA